jgi:hypothetical protein
MAFVQLQSLHHDLLTNLENDTDRIFFFSFFTHFPHRRGSGYVRGADRRETHDIRTVPCYGCVYVNNWKILCFLDGTQAT